MNFSDILPLVLVMAASMAYINNRFIGWPPAIGVMVLSLGLSVILLLTRNLGLDWVNNVAGVIHHLDFRNLLLNFLLSFLLFAGAIRLNSQKLHKERFPVTALAIAGTVISATLIGFLTFLLFKCFHFPVPLIDCFIFGTIIGPTDPVAVLGILRSARIPASLELKIAGESLFNDGIAVVLFATATEVARLGPLSVVDFGSLLIREAVGGLAFGALLGYAGFQLLKSVDDYKVEVFITLALVTGGYSVAASLHVSGPLAMVVAGLITGNKSRREGLSKVSWDYLGKFWELIDEILNVILFMLVGLEMITIKIEPVVLMIGFVAIMATLFSRWVSVALPVLLLKRRVRFEKNAIAILTWGGLKGALSIALALSLGGSRYHDAFILLTYMIVVFSILVQGLTIGPFIRRLQGYKVTPINRND